MAVRAPEIDLPGLHWFNLTAPLSLAQLRGRLLLLDFWTTGCINCIQLLPALAEIEAAFPDRVVVLGVHAPKFPAERAPATLASAIARYGIRHPVVHDPDFTLWQHYAVKAWPTLVFVSPTGYVLGMHAGEVDAGKLRRGIAGYLREAEANGKLAPALLPLSQPDDGGGNESGRFRFPGKIKALPGAPVRLALADGGHHQIVLLAEDGGELARFGSGRPGFDDGAAASASFRAPQGLIAAPDAIFVADTGNHALRRIDLASGEVRTIAGVGRRGRNLAAAPQPAVGTALASPWDLELGKGALYFANAGTHQLGRLDLESGSLSALAGSGAEALVDGAGAAAVLAQPSGLALDHAGGRLYFVDAESSALRQVDLPSGAVSTLAGAGLFAFGHVNGGRDEARLQHPLGLAWREGELLIADSFNHALRRLDLRTGQLGDFAADFVCDDALCLPLAEPAGIVALDDRAILLSDTNNHRILRFDAQTGRYATWAQ